VNELMGDLTMLKHDRQNPENPRILLAYVLAIADAFEAPAKEPSEAPSPFDDEFQWRAL